jgi:Leucine-rich repeat (LRR) protein
MKSYAEILKFLGLNLLLITISNGYIKIDELKINQTCETHCYCDLNFIKCYKDYDYKFNINSNMPSCYLKEFDINVRQFTIDFNSKKTVIEVYERTFINMTKLEILHLNRVKLNEGNLPSLLNQKNLIEITIENSNLAWLLNNLECKEKVFLKKIVFSNNDLSSESLNRGTFDVCKNVNLLDLSHNKISSLRNFFTKKTNLVSLILDNNKITEIAEFDLKYLSELTELSMSKNKLSQIHPNAFESLKNLVKLNLEKNLLHSIPAKSIIYENLNILSIFGNINLIDFPNAHEFKSLRKLFVQYSYFCCPFRKIKMNSDTSLKFLSSATSGLKKSKEVLIAEKFNHEFESSKINFELKMERLNDPLIDENQVSVNCSLEPDPFQPCENLLSEDVWISIVVWAISLMGIFCNLCVIIHNFVYIIFDYQLNNRVKVSTYLLSNLAIADLLMSIYLLFIAVEDAESRHNFFRSALVWQRSFRCNLAGFFGIASSISSALCLVFITFERYYSLKNSLYYYKRVSIKIAIIFTLIIWIISFIVASLPLFKINSYSAYAVSEINLF